MFIIEGCVVKVHLSILEAAGLSILTSVGSVLPVYLKGRLDAWCVVFMAAYGKSVLPEDAGFPATDATTFVRACDLALDYRCSAKVCTRLFRLTLAYWSSFSLWALHGQGDPAHEDHARLLQEINAEGTGDAQLGGVVEIPGTIAWEGSTRSLGHEQRH